MAFVLKGPMLGMMTKAVRGYAGEAYLVRPNRLTLVATVREDGVPLKPGEETPIAVVLRGVPRNADFKALQATLIVTPGEAVPAIGQKAVVTEGSGNNGAARQFDVRVDVPLLPRNLSVRLDGGEVFWTFSGLMEEKAYMIGELAEPVNAYLERAETTSESITLNFLVRSETPGRVRIVPDERSWEFTQLQTQSWRNDQDETIRADRNLELEMCDSERIELDAMTHSANKTATLRELRMDVAGTFGEERVLFGVVEDDEAEYVTVSTAYAVAQRVTMPFTAHCVGVGGAFRVDAATEVYAAVQTDAGGVPSADAALAHGRATIQPPPGGPATGEWWTFADFEAPCDLEPGIAYWLVVRGIQGRARLPLSPRTPALGDADEHLGAVLVNRGGQRWRTIHPGSEPGPTTAALRLRYLPTVDTQAGAIEIAVLDARPGHAAVLSRQRLDPSTAPQTVAVDLREQPNVDHLALRVRAYARGTLSIANVIQEYA